jgi:hypothetical protein
MSDCVRCPGRVVPTNNLSESLKWRANPLGVFAGAGMAAFRLVSGHGEAKQYYCTSCGGHQMVCGKCRHTSPLHTRMDHQSTFKCPSCGGLNGVYAV